MASICHLDLNASEAGGVCVNKTEALSRESEV